MGWGGEGYRVELPRHCDRQLWRYGLAKLGEAARFPGVAEEVGGGEGLRLAGLWRRFIKDCERLPQTAEAMIYSAI